MKIVSLVSQSANPTNSGSPSQMGYRILTYTSKNEFFVIDVSK